MDDKTRTELEAVAAQVVEQRDATRAVVVRVAGIVGREDEDAIHALVQRLTNALCLHLAILLRWGQPLHFHVHAVLGGELLGGRLGARARGEEHRVRRLLRDHREDDRLTRL